MESGRIAENSSGAVPTRAVRPEMAIERNPSLIVPFLLLLLALSASPAFGQCAGVVSSPTDAADCAARKNPREGPAVLDPVHPYTLAELIDIAEDHNPETRTIWERAKQKANELGLAKSAYYPKLDGLAVFGDERLINPFPEPLAPRGYVMVEVPVVRPEVTLQYLVFDFGKRKADVDSAKAERLAAGADVIRVNQVLAFRVATAYYQLVTAQERLQASQDTLRTAQTTQDAAEYRLKNGLATLPDVLNARAETAQAAFDEESADGDEKIARVTLTEAVGADPSPNIVIDTQRSAPLPDKLTMSIDSLIDRAMGNRPDLMAQILRIRSAEARVRAAKAEYKPQVLLSGSLAQTSVWPAADYGQLGSASEPTWSVALGIHWRIFDGGERKNDLLIAESKRREAEDELTAEQDETTREVWTAYISFRTALRKQDAAVALLASANASYSASLDAYKYGVKNLVDVVTAEKQLAEARLSSVSARSELFLEAVNLEFATGNLLRNQPPATTVQSQDGHP
ncbi:MAG TPA: TolC family protein [Verrucomicrobiae bacterium]|nr:TolC family protein [Verrucomicrobiae bacterium]